MTSLKFDADVDLKAADGQRRFRILAYTGGQLRVGGYDHPVVIDLEGLQASGGVPIVLDHTPSTERTIGQASEITNDRRQLVLAGDVTGTSGLVQQVIAQADAGHQWKASVGCSVQEQQPIAPGQKVSVNGQTFTGPVIVARRSVLMETSVLPIGADSATQVNLAASAAKQKDTDMTIETTITEDLQAMRDARAEDHIRIGQVEAVAAGHPQIAAAAVREGWDVTKTELEVLKAGAMSKRPSQYNTGSDGPSQADVLTASFVINAGGTTDFVAEQFSPEVVDAAERVEARGATLRTVMDAVLKAAGSGESSNRITDSYIRTTFEASQKLQASGFSTMSLPGILSNAANKLLLQGYRMVDPTWRQFCAKGNLADFKEAKRFRMTGTGEFEEFSGGQIKHLVLNTEDTYSNQLKTYAKMVSLTRKDIINDDLSAFDAIPMTLGRLAIIQLEKQVYKMLLSNLGSIFHADNSNLLTGAGSALSISSLTNAEKLFLNRTDRNGDPVLIKPQMLLVPTSLSVTAKQLVRDTQVVAVGTGSSAEVQPDSNPHGGNFTAMPTPWLENAKLTGYSATKWFMIAPPQGSAGLMEVGFLNGQETPTIETADADFNTLGIDMRGYFDFGVAFQDSHFGVQADGA